MMSCSAGDAMDAGPSSAISAQISMCRRNARTCAARAPSWRLGTGFYEKTGARVWICYYTGLQFELEGEGQFTCDLRLQPPPQPLLLLLLLACCCLLAAAADGQMQ